MASATQDFPRSVTLPTRDIDPVKLEELAHAVCTADPINTGTTWDHLDPQAQDRYRQIAANLAPWIGGKVQVDNVGHEADWAFRSKMTLTGVSASDDEETAYKIGFKDGWRSGTVPNGDVVESD